MVSGQCAGGHSLDPLDQRHPGGQFQKPATPVHLVQERRGRLEGCLVRLVRLEVQVPIVTPGFCCVKRAVRVLCLPSVNGPSL